MKRLISLSLLAILSTSQYSAISCQMDLSDRHDTRVEATEIDDAKHRSHESQGEETLYSPAHQEGHGQESSCTTFMSCGILALGNSNTSPLSSHPDSRNSVNHLANLPVSIKNPVETPPPRLA